MPAQESIPPTSLLLAGRLTVTVDEAAKLLGIGRTLAYEAVRVGELPTIRIGRRILIPVAELIRLSEPRTT
jgi:excisionase family DNA binding protein